MADIVIYCQSVNAQSDSSDDIEYQGYCRCSGMDASDQSIPWVTGAVAVGALAATINDAIKAAAIVAAGDAGYTVDALDKKTLLGGAVGL